MEKQRCRPLPDSLRRGKQLSACDNCAQAKLACDTESPCESCLVHGKDCSYTRVAADRRDSLSSWVSYEYRNPPGAPPSSADNDSIAVAEEGEPAPSEVNSCAIPFLLNYTNVKNRTILDFRRGIESTTLEDSDAGPAHSRPETERQTESPLNREAIDDVTLNLDFEHDFPQDLNFDLDPWDWSDYLFPLPSTDAADFDCSSLSVFSDEASSRALEKRAFEISHVLLSALETAPPELRRALDGWKPRFSELVNATNLRRAIRAFSKQMTPHYHWIRPREIDAETTSLPLLLAIFLAGSIYSSPEENYNFALECFDLAEHIIFESELLKGIIQKQDFAKSGISLDQPELLSAAIVILYLQMGMKDDLKRWRVRTLRFPILVKAARMLSLFSTQRPQIHDVHALTVEDQQLCNRHESLLRIAYSIFFIDCEFTIFYRQPPRLAISELVCDSPAGADVFGAPDFESWAALMEDADAKDNPSTALLLKCVMKDILDKEDEERLQSLTIFALFYLLCGLHQLIFLSQAGYTFDNAPALLDKAVNRWKTVWRRKLQRGSISHPSERIVVRVGNEFFWLAKLMLQVGDQDDELSFYDVDCLDPFSRLLQKYRNVQFS